MTDVLYNGRINTICTVERQEIYCRRIGHTMENITQLNRTCTTDRHDIYFRTYMEDNKYAQTCT